MLNLMPSALDILDEREVQPKQLVQGLEVIHREVVEVPGMNLANEVPVSPREILHKIEE